MGAVTHPAIALGAPLSLTRELQRGEAIHFLLRWAPFRTTVEYQKSGHTFGYMQILPKVDKKY